MLLFGMKFHRPKTNTFCLAVVHVKVNLLHFLRRRNQLRKPIKKFQKFIFWFTYIPILCSICSFPPSPHSSLPINNFLHSGGLAGDQILEVTLLRPFEEHIQDCSLPQLEIGAVVVLQLLLHC